MEAEVLNAAGQAPFACITCARRFGYDSYLVDGHCPTCREKVPHVVGFAATSGYLAEAVATVADEATGWLHTHELQPDAVLREHATSTVGGTGIDTLYGHTLTMVVEMPRWREATA